MTPDTEKYRAYVDGFDLTEERKIELIHTVWRIMQSFADRAFGDDPVQTCVLPDAPEDAKRTLPMLRCKDRGELMITFEKKKGDA